MEVKIVSLSWRMYDSHYVKIRSMKKISVKKMCGVIITLTQTIVDTIHLVLTGWFYFKIPWEKE